MKYSIATAVTASFLLFDSNALAASSSAAQKESSPGQPGGIFKYSTDSKVITERKNVYGTIIEYQGALNAEDTKTILGLSADEGCSQWNDKLMTDNAEKRQGQYDDLLKREKFETDFAFDSIWINGDIAVARIHHRVGSVVANFRKQKTIIDLNHEVFALGKINGKWKIFFYTFSTNSLQDAAWLL